MDKLSKYIDHTLLKADATPAQIEKLCKEAIEYDFASVCVNSCYVPQCVETLKDTDVKVCCVAGFPLGAMSSDSKAAEALNATLAGADEVDMVINVGMAKAGDWDYVKNDILNVVRCAQTGYKTCKIREARTAEKCVVKVIIETCLLTDDEKVRACLAAKEAGADFVKTSTGFSKAGATVEDVKLMRQVVGDEMGVKAAGGIHTYEEAMAMIEAGASRIGASAGIDIVTRK